MRTHGSSNWLASLNHHGARLRGADSAIMFGVFCIGTF